MRQMQELLDNPTPSAPTYASNDPVNNIDPTGMATQRGLRINEVSSRRVRLNPALTKHIWPLHSFQFKDTTGAGKSYFNAFLSAAGRKRKLTVLIKDCLNVFQYYSVQSWNGYYYSVCAVPNPAKIGYDRIADKEAGFFAVVINPRNRQLVTSFPIAVPDRERLRQVRVPVHANAQAHSGVTVVSPRIVIGIA